MDKGHSFLIVIILVLYVRSCDSIDGYQRFLGAWFFRPLRRTPWKWILKTKASHFSEMLVLIHKPGRHNQPEVHDVDTAVRTS